jgi:hypothetical protein
MLVVSCFLPGALGCSVYVSCIRDSVVILVHAVGGGRHK